MHTIRTSSNRREREGGVSFFSPTGLLQNLHCRRLPLVYHNQSGLVEYPPYAPWWVSARTRTLTPPPSQFFLTLLTLPPSSTILADCESLKGRHYLFQRGVCSHFDTKVDHPLVAVTFSVGKPPSRAAVEARCGGSLVPTRWVECESAGSFVPPHLQTRVPKWVFGSLRIAKYWMMLYVWECSFDVLIPYGRPSNNSHRHIQDHPICCHCHKNISPFFVGETMIGNLPPRPNTNI
jgi:hypothetical protein